MGGSSLQVSGRKQSLSLWMNEKKLSYPCFHTGNKFCNKHSKVGNLLDCQKFSGQLGCRICDYDQWDCCITTLLRFSTYFCQYIRFVSKVIKNISLDEKKSNIFSIQGEFREVFAIQGGLLQFRETPGQTGRVDRYVGGNSFVLPLPHQRKLVKTG